jgi:hypothetical protein
MTCELCDSPAPHLHPALQFDGEVQPCPNEFHEQVTPEKTPERIQNVRELLRDAMSREQELLKFINDWASHAIDCGIRIPVLASEWTYGSEPGAGSKNRPEWR